MDNQLWNNITRFFTTGCVSIAGTGLLALAHAAPVPAPAPEDAQPVDSKIVAESSAPAERLSAIGPGRVAFAMTPAGRWVAFGVRGAERRLVEGGGFVVMARDRSGRVFQVADTRGDGVTEVPGLQRIGVVKEGERGGSRYPSHRPDDDGDGKTDEDRLDGVDNDGDGYIDEDYAAVGDEMIVTECTSSPDSAPPLGEGQPAAGCAVSLHQECYGWSLTHIDGMVAMWVVVRNTGETPLEGVRVGAVFDRVGTFDVTTQELDGADAQGFDAPLAAKAMVITDGEWPALAAIFASESARDPEGSWLTGVTLPGRSPVDVVNAAVRPDVLARPDRRYLDDAESGVAPTGPDAATPARTGARVAYGISPVLGTLEPGAEAAIYVALVAVPSEDRANRVIDDAYRTIEGDQGHRMIPPPLSITRRNLWGSYRLRVPQDPSAGVTLTLLDPRGQNINPTEINQLEGINLRSAARTELPSGDVMFEITGDVPEEIAASERVVLSGRTSSGEMFNAILRPAEGSAEITVAAATRYFNTAGKLDEALLGSSPNPFRVATTISYEVPSRLVDENGAEFVFSGSVETSVKVYNVAGRLVSDLVETTQGPGRYDVQWTAQDAAGTGVASGVYYVKLQIGKRFVTKRLIQLK